MTQRKPLESRLFYSFLGGITLLVLFLGSSRDITVFLTVHDDRRFVNQALSLLQGQWFGHYDEITLIKGPFYPLFLAVSHLLGLPLLFSEQALYCLSGLTLIYALSYFYRQRWLLLLLYSLYVFHPASFLVNRVLREAIYGSLTMFVVAGSLLMLGHLMGRVESQRRAIAHACFLGLGAACFWLTREEGIWLVPSLGLLFALGSISQYRHRNLKAVLQRSRMLLVSLLVTAVCVLGVALTNYVHYGVFIARSELVATDFQAAYGALTRVKSTAWDAHIPVNQQARQQIYAKSDRFLTLQPHLEGASLVNGFSRISCKIYPSTCGDYAGGWFVWALRHAVAAAGYADTAPHAFAFYRDLATEVNELCDSQQLSCYPRRKGTMPPLRWEHFKQLPDTIDFGLKQLLRLDQLTIRGSQTPSRADAGGRELYTDLSRNPTIPPYISYCPHQHLEVFGWFSHLGGGTRMVQPPGRLPDGYSLPDDYSIITPLPSPDLVRVFQNPKLDNSRFKLDICCKTCTLAFTDKQERELARTDLLQGASHGSGAYGAYYLDSVKRIPPAAPTINHQKLMVLDWINSIVYKHLLYYAHILAVGLWCLRVVGYRVIPWTIGLGIATSALLAIVTLFLLLSLIDITSFPAMHPGYMSPLPPLLLLFTVIVLADTARYRKQLRLTLANGDRSASR